MDTLTTVTPGNDTHRSSYHRHHGRRRNNKPKLDVPVGLLGHYSTEDRRPDINNVGSTAITYLVEEKDIGKVQMIVKVTPEASLTTSATRKGPSRAQPPKFVGPKNLIVSNTGRRRQASGQRYQLTTTSTPKLAQSFDGSVRTTDTFTRHRRLHRTQYSANIGDTSHHRRRNHRNPERRLIW